MIKKKQSMHWNPNFYIVINNNNSVAPQPTYWFIPTFYWPYSDQPIYYYPNMNY